MFSGESDDYDSISEGITPNEDFDEIPTFDSEDEASKLEEVTRRIKQLAAHNPYFPDDSNEQLKDKIQTYKSENTRLKRCIQELETQLSLKKNVSVPKSIGGISNQGDIATSKVVELAKKVRELNAKLAKAENRACKAENELIYYKESPQIKELKEDDADKEKENQGEKEEKLKDLTEKLNGANKRLFETKNEVQQLKHELKLAHKTLASEIGDENAVQTAMTSSGWRGRAQQILSLEQKVAELTEKLKLTNVEAIEKSMMNLASSERQADKEKIAGLTKELEELKIEIADMKSKNEAAKARIKVLSSSLSESKGKLQALTYKSNQDEQMIARLSNQFSDLSERQKIREEALSKKNKDKINELEVELNQEKVKTQQLKEIIDERESRITKLEERSTDQKSSYNYSVMNGNCELPDVRSVSRASSFDRQSSISSTSETERMRLLELVTVLNRRIEEERRNLDKSQDDLRKERHKGAKLETKLAKLELGKVGALKGYQKPNNRPFTQAEYEAMKDKCELLEEKCLALESRVETLRQEKEEETRLYQHLIEDVKLSYRDQTKGLKTPPLP
ncbi:uncharacterized protein isoform X1 [Rhodnius prolixus]|uniref:Uncharacterized protein n=1 Tax=Rhodnius prolixus TaxID=13249 RepID=T1I5T0_RHOPR